MKEKEENFENPEEKNTLDELKSEKSAAKEAAIERAERSESENYSEIHEEYTPDIHDIPDEKKPAVSVKKILKYLAIFIVVFVYAIILVRIVIQKDTGVKLVKKKIANDKTVEIYKDLDKATVYSHEISGYYDTEKKIKVSHDVYSRTSKDFYGNLMVSNVLYYEESNQVVLTFRYNREALDTAKKLFGETAGDYFYFTLSDGEKSYTDYSSVSEKHLQYYYKRLIFNDVKIDLPKDDSEEGAKNLYLNIYSYKDSSFSSPIETIDVYDINCKTGSSSYSSDLFVKESEGIVNRYRNK